MDGEVWPVKRRIAIIAQLMFLAASVIAAAKDASVYRPAGAGPMAFGADEVGQALAVNGYNVTEQTGAAAAAADRAAVQVVLALRQDLGPQSYTLRRQANANDGVLFTISGGDPVGAMYGALELAERIRLNRGVEGVQDCDGKPSILRRGIKFNFPLDARTPSYDDTGTSAQENIATMWEMDFWEAYLDALARHRYNVLTLWNPHPFPSMVKTPEFPDCALDDVCMTILSPTWEHGKWADPQGVTPAILQNLKVIKRMTIDQKIAFWRAVMKRAKERGIDVYIITWNVLTNSAEGKYGIDNRQDNEKTIAYMRASVRELINTYPDLTGIGITAGENMKDGQGEFARERWLWRTYGEGVRDAKKKQSDRKVDFIHRHWYTKVADIVREWQEYPDTFSLEFKYAKARLFSSTRPPFADFLLKEMEPHGLKCWWNLRNDDIFVFRWGDPEYVRDFLRNMPGPYTAGYMLGSDGYVWAREVANLEHREPRELEIDKHWYQFMLWGRLGYDLALDRSRIEQLIEHRFPEGRGLPLFDAWQTASRIIPLVNQFHWRDWDFMWAVEGCIDQRQGFHTVRDFIKCPTMEKSGLISIRDYGNALHSGSLLTGGTRTPPQAAQQLEQWAAMSLEQVGAMRKRLSNAGPELRGTLTDIEAMSRLGLYYAEKIRGATALYEFDLTKDPSFKRRAIEHLEKAVAHWEAYATAATSQYRPQLLARTRDLDWVRILDDVRKDVDLARAAE